MKSLEQSTTKLREGCDHYGEITRTKTPLGVSVGGADENPVSTKILLNILHTSHSLSKCFENHNEYHHICPFPVH